MTSTVPAINELLVTILTNRWEEVLLGTPAILFFSTNETTAFHGGVANFAASVKKTPLTVSIHLDENPLTEPYAPFLSFIREYVHTQAVNIEELLNSVPVYPPHKPLFTAYFSETCPIRRDFLFPGEVNYEQGRIKRAILDLLCYISRRQPVIFAVSGLRHAGLATLNFCRYLLEKNDKGRLLFIFAYSNNFIPLNPERQEQWEDFLRFVEENGHSFDLQNTPKSPEPENPAFLLPVRHSTYASAPDLVTLSRINLAFLAFRETVDCAGTANSRLASMVEPAGELAQAELTEILGDAYYYLGEQNQALINYQALTERAERIDDQRALAVSLRKTGLAYLRMSNVEAARRYSQLLNNLLPEQTDDNQIRDTLFYSFFISVRNSIPLPREQYFLLKEILQSQGLENMYAYFCANGVQYAALFSSHKEIVRVCDEAIRYYRNNRNELGLSSAYHKKAVIYSNAGKFNEAMRYMQKTLQIREGLNDPMSVVRISNGIGYTNYLTGNYQGAYTHFSKSLRVLQDTGDYEEISITLFNISRLQFTAGQYNYCITVIDQLLKILHILDMHFIPYNTIEDVYLLRGLCFVKTGRTSKAAEILALVQGISEHYPWKTRFLLLFLQALVQAEQQFYQAAFTDFESALQVLSSSDDTNTDTLPLLYYEYARVLLLTGNRPLAIQKAQLGLLTANTLQSSYHRDKLNGLIQDSIQETPCYEFDTQKIELNALISLARKEALLGRLQNKIRDIRFLNIIQTELMQLTDRKIVATKLINLVSYQFPPESSYFYLIQNGVLLECLASKKTGDNFTESIKALFTAAIKIREQTDFSAIDIQRMFPEIQTSIRALSIFPILEKNEPVAALFLASCRSDVMLTTGDREILLTTAGQLGILFTKVHHDENILRLSREDPLSGLFNRQALRDKLAEEQHRFQSATNREQPRLSAAFIDLDNFKYYNDTFGHAVGDCVIVEFAKLLRATFREVDFIARYGGDEFIVLIPDTECDQARLPVQRIFEALERRNNFLPEIITFLGREAVVPEENRVSCSIGLACATEETLKDGNLELLIQQADEALHIAKQEGKHRIHLWDAATH